MKASGPWCQSLPASGASGELRIGYERAFTMFRARLRTYLKSKCWVGTETDAVGNTQVPTVAPRRVMTSPPRSVVSLRALWFTLSAVDACPQSRYARAVELVNVRSAASHAHHQREGRSGDQRSGARGKRPIVCAQL